jgi:hypothetical protein
MFELIQGLSLRENNPQPAVIARDTTWPPYGLPPGYTPPQETSTSTTPPSMPIVIPVTNETPPPQGTPAVQNDNTTPHPTVEGTHLGYTIANSPVTTDTPQDVGSTQMYQALEERLKAVEGFNICGVDAIDMCLVPDVAIPPKFKTPDFEKYKGINCPRNHLKMFCRKMAAYTTNEKLMIHVFQDSLSGASLDWYMQLERTQVQTWKDLADAFMKQYKYNLDMAPNRMQLQNLGQKDNETFKEYAQRWRELAARVQPPLLEKELIDTFMGTLQGQYYERMIGSISSNFADVVVIGERIEEGLKSGKIKGASNGQAGANKFFNNNQKKKEGETNAVETPHFQYPYVAAIAQGKYPQQVYHMPLPQKESRPGAQNNSEKKNVHFDPVPMPYGQILPYLIQKGMVEPKSLPPKVPPYPSYFDVNAKCEYHAGSPGHTIENCKGFKYKVQELIDRKLLSFKEEPRS